jgi:outer membrane receptor protein involved in Fe transport
LGPVYANNPLNTNDGYANALLGYYGTYNEWTAKIVVNDTFRNVEFYAQDNWRITKRLTLDLGLRFYHQTPEVDKQPGNQFAYFSPAAYNPANAPRLYVPAIVRGKRVAQDPFQAPLPASARLDYSSRIAAILQADLSLGFS